MTLASLRMRILRLSATSVAICFFGLLLAAFVVPSPLSSDPLRIPSMVLPILVGYLASVARFGVAQNEETQIRDERLPLVVSLVNYSYIFLILASIFLVALLAYTNQPRTSAGGAPVAFTLEQFSVAYALVLSVFTAGVNVVVESLFRLPADPAKQQPSDPLSSGSAPPGTASPAVAPVLRPERDRS